MGVSRRSQPVVTVVLVDEVDGIVQDAEELLKPCPLLARTAWRLLRDAGRRSDGSW